MNYIKKKIKGKKNVTDDDDLDPDVFHVPQAPPGAPKDWIPYDERIDHDSEEWLAFKKLTQRVTNIVEESKQNLTKIVASTALDEQTRTIKEVVSSQPVPEPFVVKKKAAPARPAPPTRPPPPSTSICPTKDFDQDKRFEAFGNFDSFDQFPFPSKGEVPAVTAHLDFDFGSSSVSDLPVPDLVLDVDNLDLGVDVAPGEHDPFDTSFVDQVDEIKQVDLLTEDCSNDLVTEDQNLSNFLENSSDAILDEDDDPFIIKSHVIAAVNMDPFDLFLQNAATVEEQQSQPSATRSRSPNPFLMDCDEDLPAPPPPSGTSTTQLHSSNPFAVSSDDNDGVGDASFDMETVPNPFADFHEAKKVTATDLFDLGLNIHKKGDFSEDLFEGSDRGADVRRSSNPFCQSEQTTTSSASTRLTFDPFETTATAVTTDVVSEQFGAQIADKYASGWLTPPGDFVDTNTQVDKPTPPPPVLSRPCRPPTRCPEVVEKPQSAALPPPRPPPPSKSVAQPPARPPPPSVTQTTAAAVSDTNSSSFDESWENVFGHSQPVHQAPPPQQPISQPRDLFEDFFGSESVPVETGTTTINNFHASLQEKVEFEPITVNINITEATPLPQKSDMNSFFDENVDGELKNDDGWASSTVSKDLPRPPSIDLGDAQQDSPVKATEVDKIEEVQTVPSSLLDDFDFRFDAVPEDTRQEAIILETEPEKVVIDTSAFEELEEKFSTMLKGQSEQETAANYDPFSDLMVSTGDGGDSEESSAAVIQNFGPSDDFDQLFGVKEIPAAPKPSPAHFDLSSGKPPPLKLSQKAAAATGDGDSPDSDDSGPDFSVFIRPKMRDAAQTNSDNQSIPVPILAPPPAKSPQPRSPTGPSRFNPFDKSGKISNQINLGEEVDDFFANFESPVPTIASVEKPTLTEIAHNIPPQVPSVPAGAEPNAEVESLGSPVFEADDTEPLVDVYPKYNGQGWDMMLRQPSKKKLTGQRYWKKVYLTLSDNGVLHLFGKREDKDAFQELPLQACYSLSEIATQQYDQYGKIFTVKLQYVFYRERVGVRPGQINKVAQGQITSLGQLAKLGLPLEHAPQVSQLLKLGSLNYEELKEFVRVVEDALFHLTVHRDRALTYKTEEIQVTVIDELVAEVANNGVVLQQVARVRVFFLAFIGNMPDVEIGLNDITKQGTEVVGRHDIIPVVTEEWIRLEKCEFHSCVVVDAFEKNRTLKLHPPDACFFELMRFRIRPPKNRELPLQVRTKMTIIGNRVEIRADVIVPGCISRKHGQIPCEDVAIRFPLPECWIYLFRTEKHFRYGSVKSTARKPGKLKGLDRFMGTGNTIEPSLIEVSTGQAKYEHQHRAIVWRVPKLPKEGQGAYSTYLFVCRMELSSYDQIPEEFDDTVYVEFYMPTTTVSHTTVRSVSVTNPNPPEKYVKYLARHRYRVGIEHVNVSTECEYVTATSGAVGGSNAANTNTSGTRSGTCSREPSDDADGFVPSN